MVEVKGIRMKDALEDLVTQGLVQNGIFYTFSTLDDDGVKYYPLQFKWEDPQCPPPVGFLDFQWTKDIKFARTWTEKHVVKTIAIEFCNTEIIRIDDNGKTKKYTTIETME